MKSARSAPGAARPAAFLDRDGTLIQDPGYLSDPRGVELLPGAADGLRALRDLGFLLVLASNQSGIGRGLFTAEALERVHARLVEVLATQGLRLDGAYYCPHAPWDGCPCRKPRPGLLQRAAQELGISLERSVMLGDKPDDVAAGRRAGCRAVLIGSARVTAPEHVPDQSSTDLDAAARWISEDLALRRG